MNQLLSGAMVLAYALVGVFFLRYWKTTRDQLFMMFAIAFWMLAAQRLALALTTEVVEDVLFLYIVRLLAFILILVAIINKNRQTKAPA